MLLGIFRSAKSRGQNVALNVTPQTWPLCFVLCFLLPAVLVLTACSPLRGEPTATRLPEYFSDLALSRDGEYLAVGTSYGLYVYQVASFQRLWFASTSHWVNSVAFSPDGQRVAAKLSGSEKSRSELEIPTVILCDAKTGERLRAWEEDETLAVGWVKLAFSPDGTKLVSGRKHFDFVIVRDIETGEQAYIMGQLVDGWVDCGPDCPIWDVVWSPAGDRMAFGLADDTVAIWDTVTGTQLRVMEGNVQWAHSLAFSPDGTLLASEMGLGELVIWNAETGKALHVIKSAVDSRVRSVAFSPDGRMLASGWAEGTIILWDVETGEQVRTLEGHSSYSVFSVAFTPDGDALISGSLNEIIVWDIKTGKQMHILESQ